MQGYLDSIVEPNARMWTKRLPLSFPGHDHLAAILPVEIVSKGLRQNGPGRLRTVFLSDVKHLLQLGEPPSPLTIQLVSSSPFG